MTTVIESAVDVSRAAPRLRTAVAGPGDEPALHALFADCTPETVRLRFFGRLREFPRPYLGDALTSPADVHDAVVAYPYGPDGGGLDGGARTRLAGLASLAVSTETGIAELGVLVGDAWQRQGAGGAMIGLLLARARERGVERVSASVLPGRSALLAALARRLPQERTWRTMDGLTGVYKLV